MIIFMEENFLFISSSQEIFGNIYHQSCYHNENHTAGCEYRNIPNGRISAKSVIRLLSLSLVLWDTTVLQIENTYFHHLSALWFGWIRIFPYFSLFPRFFLIFSDQATCWQGPRHRSTGGQKTHLAWKPKRNHYWKMSHICQRKI